MSEIIEVVLVRHGLPNQIEGVANPDPGLTERGFEQARAVAAVMAVLPVWIVASRALLRAKQTVAPSAEKLGIAVDVYEDLAEFDSGADDYIPIEDMVGEADPRLDQWRELMAQPDMAGVVVDFRRTVTTAVAHVAAPSARGVVAILLSRRCHRSLRRESARWPTRPADRTRVRVDHLTRDRPRWKLGVVHI